jgi:hypothetical protein
MRVTFILLLAKASWMEKQNILAGMKKWRQSFEKRTKHDLDPQPCL